jgi:hypothetical protein
VGPATHQGYGSFFDDSRQVKLDEDTDSHTIRKRGLYRYYSSHQNINIRKLNNYFIFTFVRNPYDRIFSAYNYLKKCLLQSNDNNKIRNSYEKKEYFESFATFINNRENVNNISFFHAFIPQYQHFVDDNGEINIHYIGRQETLDNDFLEILSLLGIKSMHMDLVSKDIRLNASYNDDSKRKNELVENYTKEAFNYVNMHFEKDFEIFGYKKYETFEEFQKKYGYDESYVSNTPLNILNGTPEGVTLDVSRATLPENHLKRMDIFDVRSNSNVHRCKKDGLLQIFKRVTILNNNKVKTEQLLKKNEEILSILLNQINIEEENKDITEIVKGFNENLKSEILNKNADIELIFKKMTEYVKDNHDTIACDYCKKGFITHNTLARRVHCHFCRK